MFVINQDISVIVCNAKSRESFMRLLAILLCACIYGLSAQAHSGGQNSSGGDDKVFTVVFEPEEE